MRRLRYIFVLLLVVLFESCDGVSELDERWSAIDNDVLIQVEEEIGYDYNPHGPVLQLTLTSERGYPSTCYQFAVSSKELHGTLFVWIEGVGPVSFSCGQSIEPARSVLTLDGFEPGTHEVQVISDLGADRFKVDVSADFIEVSRLSAATFTQLPHPKFWRVKEHTFALKCGALCEDIHVCSDLAQRFIDELGVKELEVPSDALDAFGGPIQGHYCNGPLRVFLGEDEQAFVSAGRLVGSLLETHLLGASAWLVNWTGERGFD